MDINSPHLSARFSSSSAILSSDEIRLTFASEFSKRLSSLDLLIIGTRFVFLIYGSPVVLSDGFVANNPFLGLNLLEYRIGI
ncbi:11920_t:CDS:2, partial [Funneliformis caledonium]